MANGGSLTLNEAGINVGDTVSGSLSNVTLREIDNGGDVPNGCTTTLMGTTFSATTEAPPG